VKGALDGNLSRIAIEFAISMLTSYDFSKQGSNL